MPVCVYVTAIPLLHELTEATSQGLGLELGHVWSVVFSGRTLMLVLMCPCTLHVCLQVCYQSLECKAEDYCQRIALVTEWLSCKLIHLLPQHRKVTLQYNYIPQKDISWHILTDFYHCQRPSY